MTSAPKCGVASIFYPEDITDDPTYGDGVLQRKSRIVGGEEAKAHSWPWQVAMVHEKTPGNWTQFCGGMLISESWIVTAGHCM